MKKSTKVTALILSAFVVTACFDADKKEEIKPVPKSAVTSQNINDAQPSQEIHGPHLPQSKLQSGEVEVKKDEIQSQDTVKPEQPTSAEEQKQEVQELTVKDDIEVARAEYIKFDEFKIKLEQGLIDYQEKLAAIQQGKLDKEQATKIIQELSDYTKKIEINISNYPLKSEIVKKFRDQTIETVSLSNKVLLNAVNLILSLESDKEKESREIVDVINKQVEELDISTKKLEDMKLEIEKLLNL